MPKNIFPMINNNSSNKNFKSDRIFESALKSGTKSSVKPVNRLKSRK